MLHRGGTDRDCRKAGLTPFMSSGSLHGKKARRHENRVHVVSCKTKESSLSLPRQTLNASATVVKCKMQMQRNMDSPVSSVRGPLGLCPSTPNLASLYPIFSRITLVDEGRDRLQSCHQSTSAGIDMLGAPFARFRTQSFGVRVMWGAFGGAGARQA